MTAVVLGVVLAALGLWILQPLRGRRVAAAGPVDDVRWKELVDAKHAVYRSILELEFDRSVGKVAEEDYAIVRRQQEGEALGLLHEMDAMAARAAGSSEVPVVGHDTIEAEIAAARERLHPRTS
jgi:hypothetical protein